MARLLLLYDGDCGFCRGWVERWRRWAGPGVEWRPYQEPGLIQTLPGVNEEECAEAVVLFDRRTKRKVSGAEAVFRVLGTRRPLAWLPLLYKKAPPLAAASERDYRWVAGHRPLLSRLTLAWSGPPFPPGEGPSYLYARWAFLRILGVGFATSFLSLAVQVHGLIGPEGVLPAGPYLDRIAETIPGPGRFLAAPTLLWLGAGDAALSAIVSGGLLAGLALAFNLAPRWSALACWTLHLSFCAAARRFSGFQFDSLLLESALLAVFLAPPGLRPGLGRRHPPGRAVRLMLWWLLFRLMLESGAVKLLSGDPHWRGLTAMDGYYENSPFPTWVGWFVQKLPHGFHALCVLWTFFVELVLPWAIWIGRRPRFLAAAAWSLLQIGILLTSNYAFLNWNSIALALMLVDDRAWAALASRARSLAEADRTSAGVKSAFRRTGMSAAVAALERLPEPVRAPLSAPGLRWAKGALFALLFYVSFVQLAAILGAPAGALPGVLLAPLRAAEPFRSANRYGLFAVMTEARDQIFYEGSRDGRTWKRYRLKRQPHALDERPRFMAPHLPRFDWNLWFAVLGEPRRYPFVHAAAARLLEGSDAVEGLFAENPFPGGPPRLIRLPVERYRFSTWDRWRETGEWWTREPRGEYGPRLLRARDGRIVAVRAGP